ncbi:MAG: nucleotidyltransferase family protein [Eubacteriales bacterium]|nr:nucleotidyltransferase family protein [Eubacteriales bacterium]
MKVTGIIAECNPLHNGHDYLIQSARRETGADYLILAISGDYVQRGEPAVIDKYARTRALLARGADLVLELPLCYACGGADYFARGAVALLDSLGVVTDLCFGSESGDTALLQRAADTLRRADRSDAVQAAIRAYLKQGLSYPAAREQAIREHGAAFSPVTLSSPNDLLAAEYCRALADRDSAIRPHAIHRISTDSASGIRSALQGSASGGEALMLKKRTGTGEVSGPDTATDNDADSERQGGIWTEHFSSLALPLCMKEELTAAWNLTAPVFADDFSAALLYRLQMSASFGSLSDCLDVSPDLAARIENLLPQFQTWTQFCALLKTKNLTYTRISRALLHILLNLRKSHMAEYKAAGLVGYARLLGFRKEAAPLLTTIKANASVPLLSKLSAASDLLPPVFQRMLGEDIRAAELYDAIARGKFFAKRSQKALPPFRRECQREIERR